MFVLQKDMGDLDYRSVSKEKTDLLDKQNEILNNKNVIIGVTNELKNQIDVATKFLKQDKYKNSLKNYQEVFYEVQVIKKLSNDLQTYRAALEWALIKYERDNNNYLWVFI